MAPAAPWSRAPDVLIRERMRAPLCGARRPSPSSWAWTPRYPHVLWESTRIRRITRSGWRACFAHRRLPAVKAAAHPGNSVSTRTSATCIASPLEFFSLIDTDWRRCLRLFLRLHPCGHQVATHPQSGGDLGGRWASSRSPSERRPAGTGPWIHRPARALSFPGAHDNFPRTPRH